MDRKEDAQKRKERSKQIKILHILDCAETVMSTGGIHALSMDVLSKEAKVAKGTLYLYFKSKEDVIGQLTIRSREALLKMFYETTIKEKDPINQIRAILWVNYNFYKKFPLYSQLVSFYEVNTGLKETESMMMSSHNISNYIMSIFQKAKQAKAIRDSIDVGVITYSLWGMCVGMIQLIDIKFSQIQLTLTLTEKEFYSQFVEFTIEALR